LTNEEGGREEGPFPLPWPLPSFRLRRPIWDCWEGEEGGGNRDCSQLDDDIGNKMGWKLEKNWKEFGKTIRIVCTFVPADALAF
jgi:hypothetical protein